MHQRLTPEHLIECVKIPKMMLLYTPKGSAMKIVNAGAFCTEKKWHHQAQVNILDSPVMKVKDTPNNLVFKIYLSGVPTASC